jgi:LmbE family N-acetylglucosaminyl deacetylase
VTSHAATEDTSPAARRTVVSPHLDDAALSASAELARGGATVLTVFSAPPPPGRPPSGWDLLTGASDSHQRVLDRRAEDHNAMRLLGADSIYLEEFENLYRDGDPDLDGATDLMAAHFAQADEVWVPAAIGGHPDHRFARDAALQAASKAGHGEVVLYADFPYVLRFGWPAGTVGAQPDPYLDADVWLAYTLREAGLDPAALAEPTVTRLDADQRALKAKVIGAYPTQASALGLAPRHLEATPGKLDFELSWRVAVTDLG